MANYATVKATKFLNATKEETLKSRIQLLQKVYNTVHWINLYRACNTDIIHWI